MTGMMDSDATNIYKHLLIPLLRGSQLPPPWVVLFQELEPAGRGGTQAGRPFAAGFRVVRLKNTPMLCVFGWEIDVWTVGLPIWRAETNEKPWICQANPLPMRASGPQHFQPTAWLLRVASWGLGRLGPGQGWLWHRLGTIIFGHHYSILLAYGSYRLYYRLLAHTLCSTPNGQCGRPQFSHAHCINSLPFKISRRKTTWNVLTRVGQAGKKGKSSDWAGNPVGTRFTFCMATLAENMDILSDFQGAWNSGAARGAKLWDDLSVEDGSKCLTLTFSWS